MLFLIVYEGPYSLQLCCYAASLSIFNFCIAGPYANYFFILTNFAFAFLVAMWDHTHCNFTHCNFAIFEQFTIVYVAGPHATLLP